MAKHPKMAPSWKLQNGRPITVEGCQRLVTALERAVEMVYLLPGKAKQGCKRSFRRIEFWHGGVYVLLEVAGETLTQRDPAETLDQALLDAIQAAGFVAVKVTEVQVQERGGIE